MDEQPPSITALLAVAAACTFIAGVGAALSAVALYALAR